MTKFIRPALVVILTILVGCSRVHGPITFEIEEGTDAMSAPADEERNASGQNQSADVTSSMHDRAFAEMRAKMVDRQIQARGIRDRRVLDALATVPRHRFVPLAIRHQAYDDRALPIGHGQTISQPYIVGLMTDLVRPQPGDRALDIGTGCGYQAAVLAELVAEVYSIEIVEHLVDEASVRLDTLGYKNVHVRHGDGYQGWVEHAPFQVILVAAAPDHVPQPLLEQLAPGGRMAIPVGKHFQELLFIEKQADGKLRETVVAPVAFVPMTGEADDRRRPMSDE